MQTFPGMKQVTSKNFLTDFSKGLTGTAKSMVLAALEQNVRVFKLFDKRPMFILKKGEKSVWIQGTLTSLANPIGINIARNKHLTKIFLEALGYPTAPGLTVSSLTELMSAVKKVGFPVVVKPSDSGEGKGVTVNIKNKVLLKNSFEDARRFGKKVIVEKYIEGDYYRITYITDGSFAATKNVGAFIVGDGIRSAGALIKNENVYNEERCLGGRLKKIKVSGTTKRFLISKGYTLKSIITKGERLPICFSGHGGGEYIDVTDTVHPFFLKLARTVSKYLDLPVIGIDIIAASIEHPLGSKTNGVIIEINGTFPAFDFHKKPTVGESRDLAPQLIRYLLNR
jgi:cyanophycin synthetase